jgi:subtilisin-like proprotein convertase family protein
MRPGSLYLRLVTLSLLGLPLGAHAVPGTLSMEGALRNAAGLPVSDGSYVLTVNLYKDEQGGAPLYSQGPAAVQVKGGVYQLTLGQKQQLEPKLFADGGAAWLEVVIDPDPALPRTALRSVATALRAGEAEALACSGCVTAQMLAGDAVAGLVSAGKLATVAQSGQYTDLKGAPDLAVYAKKAELSAVAASGAYGDLKGTPDLAAYAQKGDLAAYAQKADLAPLAAKAELAAYAQKSALAGVAFTGDYGDLNGKPVLAKVGTACGTGLGVTGLAADGSLQCAPVGSANLAPDAIGQVSNGLIVNQYNEIVASSGAAVAIPDNNPVGASSELVVPDLGVVQKLTVTVDIANSDLSTLKVTLFDPTGAAYVLAEKGKGTLLQTSFPAPTPTVSGNLNAWVGKNAQGKWSLSVVDLGFLNNKTDGALNKWSIQIGTLSSKKVQVKGNLLVDGSVKMGADATSCGSINAGAVRWTGNDLQVCTGTAWRKLAYVPPPTITSIVPNSGPLAGGSTLTLTGSNYSPEVTVTVGGVPCAKLTYVSTTQLQCVTPAAQKAGAFDVAALIGDTGQTVAGGFTYLPIGKAYELGGLVAWFDVSEPTSWPGSGAVWKDAMGISGDANMLNGLTAGSLGGVGTMVFNGTGAGAQFANGKLNTQKFTAVYWVYSQNPASDTNQGGLYVNHSNTDANAPDWVWFGKYIDNWYFRVNNGGCCTDLTGSGNGGWSAAIPQNQWRMVHFGFEAGGQWKWGVNGQNVSAAAFSGRPNSQTAGVSTIGWGHSGSGSFWKGGISAARFYDRLLSDQELAAEYGRLKGLYGL